MPRAQKQTTSEFRPRRALVVLPTYNEKDNLPELLPQILNQDKRLHVLVVDDASPDQTGLIADGLAAVEARMNVMHRPGKLGLGTAYVDGFRWGMEQGFDVFITMDADLSHDPQDLPRFLSDINKADVVVGSRYLNGEVTVVHWPMTRLMLSYFANQYARVVTGMPVSDATGGFTAYRRPVIDAIGLDSLRSGGYAFQIELKHRAWRAGFRLRELGIVFTDRTRGDSKMSSRVIREAVWRVWQFRLRGGRQRGRPVDVSDRPFLRRKDEEGRGDRPMPPRTGVGVQGPTEKGTQRA